MADWVQLLAGVRRDQIVEGAGAMRRQLAVGVAVVVEHLIFERLRRMRRLEGH